MSEETLVRVFERVFSSPFVSDQITILWHAGEPLVLGVDYYERAFAIAEKARPKGLAVTHNFQTNATLLNQKWIDFFKTAGNVTVGVSIDGPPTLHDMNRKTRRGSGSFEQVMRGIRVLQINDFPFNVITVLNRNSLKCSRELFQFYVANGFRRIAFNIEEVEGSHQTSSLQDHSVDQEIRDFYREFLDLMERSGVALEVREFSAAFSAIADEKSARYGNPLAQPLRTISIGVNGEISTFSPELLGYGSPRHGRYVFGNVCDNSIADILQNSIFLEVNAEIERGIERCRLMCDYFDICRGGAPANKMFENGTFDSDETLFCRMSKKAVIDVVLDRMERALELA